MRRKGMRARFVSIIAAALALCALCGCGPAEKGVKLTLNEVTHSVFYAPQYAAIELGYFEDEGLELELVNGGGADKVMTAILAGQADIGLCGPEASVYVYNEGMEDHAVVIGQLTKRDGAFLVGRAPEPGFTWESLRGKSVIGGRKGGMPEMTFEYVLRQNGLEPGVDLQVDTSVQFNLMGGAFEGGQGDYVTLFEPVASTFELAGKGYVLAAVGSASGELPATAYQVKKSALEKNPGVYQRFLNAVARGQKWVAEHSPQEIAKVIKPQFPDTDEATLTMVAKRYKDIDAWMATPVVKAEAFEQLQVIMTEAGELSKKAPFAELVDNTLAEKAK